MIDRWRKCPTLQLPLNVTYCIRHLCTSRVTHPTYLLSLTFIPMTLAVYTGWHFIIVEKSSVFRRATTSTFFPASGFLCFNIVVLILISSLMTFMRMCLVTNAIHSTSR